MSRGGVVAVARGDREAEIIACHVLWPRQSLPAVGGEPSLDNQLSTMPEVPLPLEQLAQTLSRRRAVEFVRGHIEHQFFPLTAIG